MHPSALPATLHFYVCYFIVGHFFGHIADHTAGIHLPAALHFWIFEFVL